MTSSALLECCSPLVRPSLSAGEAVELERLFKALADRHRVRIVNLLASADDAVCVCALLPALGLAQATVSYHLKLLTDAGLLERERRGRFAYYRLADGALDRLGELMAPEAAA
ncbi:MAG TPA: metalloregulator ArsR/SmtB family transcription factor [Gaiellaceae bacterium]|nr:metalloregulator ArsR/SmtB family transcription factor [Gaiellaceae bacterium]